MAEYMDDGRTIRKFVTGAVRDSDIDKLDYEGFLSPLVVQEFARYMHMHRIQADGNLRDSDNWQKGIPKSAYMKSLFRHMMDLWLFHRGHEGRETIKMALCGIMFNAMGYLHEILKADESVQKDVEDQSCGCFVCQENRARGIIK